MTSEQPLTPREVAQLIASVEALTVTINSLRDEMGRTYVRKDVYSSDRKADSAEGATLSHRIEKVEMYWARLAWAIGLMVLGALVSLVLVQNGGSGIL